MLHRFAVCLFIFLSLVCAEAQQYPEKDFMPILREKGRFVFDRMPECWSSSEVWTVPDWRDEACGGVMPDGIRCGRLTGMNYQGKPTDFPAVYGLPEGGGKVPAVVLVPGRGTRQEHAALAAHWIKLGYAAIVVDALAAGGPEAGEMLQGTDDTGTVPANFFCDKAPLAERLPFYASSAVIKAHSFIRTLDRVDADRCVLAGSGWGAMLSGVAAGVDARFKAHAMLHACGYADDTTFLSKQLLEPRGFLGALNWLENWDPALYLQKSSVPVLFVTDANNQSFLPRSWQRTTAVAAAPVFRSIHNRNGKSLSLAGCADMETFFRNAVGVGVNVIPKPEKVVVEDGRVTGSWLNVQKTARLEVTCTAGDWAQPGQPWTTQCIDEKYAGGKYAFQLPPESRCFYVSIVDDAGVRHSTGYRLMSVKMQFLGTGAGDYSWKNYGEEGSLGTTSTLLDDHILIDCGGTVAKALERLKVDASRITHLVITHSHSDHFWLEAVRKAFGERKIHFYGSPELCEIMKDYAVVHPLKPGDSFTIGEYKFTTLLANHVLRNPSELPFNYLISGKGKHILYAIDTAWLSSHAVRLTGQKYLSAIIWDATVAKENDWRLFDHNDLNMIRYMRKTLTKTQNIDEATLNLFSHRARTLWPKTLPEQEAVAEREKGRLCYEGEIFYLQ